MRIYLARTGTKKPFHANLLVNRPVTLEDGVFKFCRIRGSSRPVVVVRGVELRLSGWGCDTRLIIDGTEWHVYVSPGLMGMHKRIMNGWGSIGAFDCWTPDPRQVRKRMTRKSNVYIIVRRDDVSLSVPSGMTVSLQEAAVEHGPFRFQLNASESRFHSVDVTVGGIVIRCLLNGQMDHHGIFIKVDGVAWMAFVSDSLNWKMLP